jgi:hypothetical protein
MKYFSVSLLFALLCLAGYTQDKFIPKVTIGINTGLNHSNVRFTDPINSLAVDGIGWGVFFNYISEPHLGIQVEMDYSPRGWYEKGNDTVVGYERRLGYLQFPILTKITFGSKLVWVDFELGPYFAFLREDYEGYHSFIYDTDFSSHDTIIGLQPVYNHYDRYGNGLDNKFDYGFILGFGPRFHTLLGDFGIQFRYSLGLAQIFTRYPDGDFKFSQMQSFYLGLSYSYALNLRKAPPK